MDTEASASTTATEPLWWFKEDDETRGPMFAADVRKLGLHPNTLVWREDFGDRWKRYDMTELAKPSVVPSPVTPPPVTPPPVAAAPTPYDPKWEPTFAKFDNAEGFHYTRSIWALVFGVFYYFYLRMWKKGFIIFGFTIWTVLILEILEKTAGLPDFSRFAGIAANGLCMIFAERDFYLWKRRGETVWPSLRALSNAWILGVFVACRWCP